jgi:hypothetical protein
MVLSLKQATSTPGDFAARQSDFDSSYQALQILSRVMQAPKLPFLK